MWLAPELQIPRVARVSVSTHTYIHKRLSSNCKYFPKLTGTVYGLVPIVRYRRQRGRAAVFALRRLCEFSERHTPHGLSVAVANHIGQWRGPASFRARHGPP